MRAVPARAAAMAPGAAAAAALASAPALLLLPLLLAAAARPAAAAAAAAWDLWALRCAFSADCECGFGPDLRGQRAGAGGAEGWRGGP